MNAIKQCIQIRCIVGCLNSVGEPDLFIVKVIGTKEQYDNGDFYDAAKDECADRGYEPKIVFDENDPGGRAMLRLFRWASADVVHA